MYDDTYIHLCIVWLVYNFVHQCVGIMYMMGMNKIMQNIWNSDIRTVRHIISYIILYCMESG